jgi:Putative metallopeptidase
VIYVAKSDRTRLSAPQEDEMMKAALIPAIAGTLLSTVAAVPAQEASKPNQISISYELPKNSKHQRIYNRMKERRSLENLQEFLSPFKLPRTLKIELAGCDGEADARYFEDVITVCYEYLDELWRNMPRKVTASGVAPIDTILGPLIDTTLHEFAHALFDMLKVPVFGREEDAADQVAAYIYLHLGKAEARRLIMATRHAYMTEVKGSDGPPTLAEFSEEHGTPAQRMFNLLCIAYGADPKLFGDVVSKGYLPRQRAEQCQDEYEQIQDAFNAAISPHIDRDLAEKILKRDWLPKTTAPF